MQEELLSQNFLSKYKNKQPNWGFNGLGYIVYKRTYARPKSEGITEEWWETIERCINGLQRIGAHYTREEAEQLFDYVFHLKGSFSGRALWQLGTPLVDNLKLGDSLVNCLAGETKVLTRSGWKEIKFLEGTEQEIVTDNGKWVKASFKNFGRQKLLEITFKEAYSSKEFSIFATENHEWIIKNVPHGSKKRRITKDLQVGDIVPIVLGRNTCNYLSPQGVQHGLVFGDGSCDGYESQIDLIGNTYLYCNKYFTLNRVKWTNPENKNHVRYGGMPNFYKKLPNINENKPYLMGFLAGWLAADGNVKKYSGSIRLFNKDKQVLQFARDIASVCGFRTTEPYLERNENPFNGEVSELWSISFNLADNCDILIIKDDHKQNLSQKMKRRQCDYAKILNVKQTDRIEEVYCAQVDNTHSFVIEGNILTGNCWVTKLSQIEDFCFILMESMFGGGVSPNLAREYTQELPRVKRGVRCYHKNTNDADFIVPDSKEGWVKLWYNILKSYLVTGESFSFSTVCIRPAGEPLKTFGGICPGALPLIQNTLEICKILESREGKKLRTQDIADIICCGGEMVKSGGVRRTALLLAGETDDFAFHYLKRWDLGNIPNYRSNSNNSLLCPKFNYIPSVYWEGFDGNGETYGLINLPLIRKFGRLNEERPEPNIINVNPCGEATLEDKEPCNLSELAINNLSSKEEMLELAKLLYKGQKAICALNYYHKESNEVVHRNFKLGLSITGVCQRMDVIEQWANYVYVNLKKFDKEWSKKRNWPESIKLTVIQPSGTKGLIFGSSPGGHPAYSQYFIRRIRFDSKDPLILILKQHGYKIQPEVRFDGSLNHNLLVVDFPCSFDKNAILSKNFGAINQLELIKKLQTCWADQSVSVTVYYTKEEIPKIKDYLKENYDKSIKSVSFLLHSEHGFKQAPYEEISEETYKEMLSKINKFKTIEHIKNSDTDGIECANGTCPIK